MPLLINRNAFWGLTGKSGCPKNFPQLQEKNYFRDMTHVIIFFSEQG